MEVFGGNAAFDGAIAVPGLDAYVYSRPFGSSTSGGDVHYISTCGHRNIARFAVADVAGHGGQVGQISARLRALMRKHINTLDQTRFVRTLNHDFAELADDGTFATALLTSYYAPTDDLVICNAGHPPPLWYRAADTRWDYLTHDSKAAEQRVANLPLGIIEPTEYTQFAVRLARGDCVLLYTDSLIEAEDANGQQIGSEGLLKLARTLDLSAPERIQTDLIDRLDAYQGGRAFADDVTLIVLYHNAADPPRLSVGEYLGVIGKVFRLIRV